jgi:hypothetical protein
MTGTNYDLFTHKSSRSYLNHLVYRWVARTVLIKIMEVAVDCGPGYKNCETVKLRQPACWYQLSLLQCLCGQFYHLWRWRQHIFCKCQCQLMNVHGVKIQSTIN